MTSRFRSVINTEDERDEAKERADRADYFSAKLHALVWVILSALVAYYLDIAHLVMHDDRVGGFALYGAGICLSVNAIIIVYLTLW